jgi:hypothetical protein
MWNAYGKYGALGMLVVAMLLGLMLAAGPAVADVGPLGPQWGGHEVNAKMWMVDSKKGIRLQVVADDPRVSGFMDVSIKNRWYDADGTGHQSGTSDLYNDAGNWHCAYWEVVYFFNEHSAEYPVQSMCLDCTATGSGAYKGLVFYSAHHQVGGSPFILKGWILPAN